MSVKIMIPTPLRAYTGQKEQVEVNANTVGEALKALSTLNADLKKHLFTDSGELRNFVNVYLNSEDIRYLKNTETPVTSGDTLTIVPSIAGGSS
jgi:molybdopterin converting factor small subunit